MNSKLLLATILLCLSETSFAELPKRTPTAEGILVCATGVLTAIDLLNKGLLFSELKREAQNCQDLTCRNATSNAQTTCAVALGIETLVPVAAATTLAAFAFSCERVERTVHVATLFAFIGSTGGFVATIIGFVNSPAERWLSSIIMMSAVEAGALIASSVALYNIRENRRTHVSL